MEGLWLWRGPLPKDIVPAGPVLTELLSLRWKVALSERGVNGFFIIMF